MHPEAVMCSEMHHGKFNTLKTCDKARSNAITQQEAKQTNAIAQQDAKPTLMQSTTGGKAHSNVKHNRRQNPF